ncbi:CRAL/TRIO domain-containing protein [Phellopilus nigrolimitatus]|nr:CRAL/TRIO domain-containing protein [Phellopilus nigrolimitatus]
MSHEPRKHPELTEEQERVLQTFREELLEEGHDWILLRFLRAPKIMIKNCVEWRRTAQGVGIDELYRRLDPYDFPERDEVFKHWPIWYHKRGWPINVHSLGGIDTTALYQVITPVRFWESILSAAEGAMREILAGSSYAAGRPIDDIFVIVDLKDFGLGKFWQMKSLIQDSFQISQDYFPETMGLLVIINAPYTFSVIWNVVRSWLAKETQDKVRLFGADYEPFLLEHIDAANLPASLGGTCTCDDAGGCQFSNVGPWMEDRKERREAWLRGERSRPGLGLEDREKGKEKLIDSAPVSPVSPIHHVPHSISANEY